MKTKIILIFIFLFIFSPLFLGAQGRPLETDYPVFSGYQITTTAVSLPGYVVYIFWFVIAISGFFALFSIISGGMRYVASTGSPEATKAAKEQVLSAFAGILILFGSVLILNAINPQFTRLSEGDIPSLSPVSPIYPGVLLCETELSASIIQEIETTGNVLDPAARNNIYENCVFLLRSGEIKKDIEKIYIIPDINDENKKYGAILYGLETVDKAQLVYNQSTSTVEVIDAMKERIRYGKPFDLISDYEEPITVELYPYQDLDSNEDNEGKLKEFILENKSIETIDLRGQNSSTTHHAENGERIIGSLRIKPPFKALVVFVKELDIDWQEGMTIWEARHVWVQLPYEITKIGNWCVKEEGFWASWFPGLFGEKIACASHMVIIPQR